MLSRSRSPLRLASASTSACWSAASGRSHCDPSVARFPRARISSSRSSSRSAISIACTSIARAVWGSARCSAIIAWSVSTRLSIAASRSARASSSARASGAPAPSPSPPYTRARPSVAFSAASSGVGPLLLERGQRALEDTRRLLVAFQAVQRLAERGRDGRRLALAPAGGELVGRGPEQLERPLDMARPQRRLAGRPGERQALLSVGQLGGRAVVAFGGGGRADGVRALRSPAQRGDRIRAQRGCVLVVASRAVGVEVVRGDRPRRPPRRRPGRCAAGSRQPRDGAACARGARAARRRPSGAAPGRSCTGRRCGDSGSALIESTCLRTSDASAASSSCSGRSPSSCRRSPREAAAEHAHRPDQATLRRRERVEPRGDQRAQRRRHVELAELLDGHQAVPRAPAALRGLTSTRSVSIAYSGTPSARSITWPRTRGCRPSTSASRSCPISPAESGSSCTSVAPRRAGGQPSGAARRARGARA